jgi:hypothetical protein
MFTCTTFIQTRSTGREVADGATSLDVGKILARGDSEKYIWSRAECGLTRCPTN